MSAPFEGDVADMSKFWRLVCVSRSRVSGTFWVSRRGDRPTDRTSVSTVDVVVWDEGRHWGRTLTTKDLTAWVNDDGTVDLPKHMIREDVRDDVEDAWDEMLAAIKVAAEVGGRP